MRTNYSELNKGEGRPGRLEVRTDLRNSREKFLKKGRVCSNDICLLGGIVEKKITVFSWKRRRPLGEPGKEGSSEKATFLKKKGMVSRV